MKTRAVSMVLLMIASALAGCAGSDPDGDTGIDTDMLNEMIDENLQDFINNTTVTVNQEIHYHNNTTYVENSESNTNIGGAVSGGNGTGISSIIQVMRIQENFPGSITHIGELQFIQDGILQFPAIGFAPTMTYNIGGNIVSMNFTCEELVNAMSLMDRYEWEDWARIDLGMSWSDADALSTNIYYDLQEFYDELLEYCHWGHTQYVDLDGTLFSMEISEGESVSFMQIPSGPETHWDLSCDDGYHDFGVMIWDLPTYIGGWTDCTFTTYYNWTVMGSYQQEHLESENSNDNNSNTSTWRFSELHGTPDWFDWNSGSHWYEWTGNDGSSSFDGIFYFTKYFVVPLE
ncbi:MAG: hypothetical protein VYE70_05845 [Candidatus Thermoplasmatota archaeon]|nr:hypothetical protein [Candidatus Thermoplasmatota archaeon]